MATLRYLTGLALLLAAIQAQNFNGNSRSSQASNRFNYLDIDILKELISEAGTHNFVISPASMKVVLGMLMEGSKGNTAKEIERALRLNGDPASQHMIFNSFVNSLKVRYPGTVVEFANQIFVSPDTKVQLQYQDTLQNVFLSGVQSVPFADRHIAASAINGWVSKNTHGFIRTLVPPQSLDPHTKAIVANALYFRGKWAVPFDKKATTERCFYSKPGVCQTAYFMETVGQHGYANLKDLNAKVLEMMYQGSKYSMIFLLPNNGIDELMRDLPYLSLNNIIPKIVSTTLVLSVPRFSIEFETDLTNSMRKLQISEIFSPTANLSGLAGGNGKVYISKIFQKAIIEIDEEGTVGAAATGAVAVPLQGPTLPRFEASRPFLFFLRDIETGNYLFEGLVEQPELVNAPQPSVPQPPVSQPPSTSLSGSSNPQLSSGPSEYQPVPSLEINPVNNKFDKTPLSNTFSHQPANFNPQNRPSNGQGSESNTFATSGLQSANQPDSIHYPQ